MTIVQAISRLNRVARGDDINTDDEVGFLTEALAIENKTWHYAKINGIEQVIVEDI